MRYFEAERQPRRGRSGFRNGGREAMALVEIVLNGEARKLKAGTTVEDLVRDLGLVPGRLAVEYNLQILKRKRWAATALNQGDRLEIVHFVGGGASTGPRLQRQLHQVGPNQREASSHAMD